MTKVTHEQETPGLVRTETQPLLTGCADRVAASNAENGVLLLACRAAGRRRWLRSHHRPAWRGQVGQPADARRAALGTARRESRCALPAPGQPRRLLPRDGRSLWRAAATL